MIIIIMIIVIIYIYILKYRLGLEDSHSKASTVSQRSGTHDLLHVALVWEIVLDTPALVGEVPTRFLHQ